MFFIALQAVKQRQDTLAITAAAQTSAAAGWTSPGNTDMEVFLVQPLNADVTVTIDGLTTPVAGTVGFVLQQGVFTVMTRGEMVLAKWIAAGNCVVNVQGCSVPVHNRSLF